MTAVVVLAAITAVAAAVRSTWSPCGLSMLSSITPFGENARGHRYGFTAAWFLAGAAVGGACLGAVVAGLTAVASASGLLAHPAVVLVIAGGVGVTGAAVDAGRLGPVLPLVRRQVNDSWLSLYRRWVYAGGFGWQIGSGVTTYVMTAAVFGTVVLAALTGNGIAAVVICSGFGLLRGAAVFLTSGASTPSRLRRLHSRVDRAGDPVRRVVCAVQLAVGAAALADQWPVVGLAVAVAAAVWGLRRAVPSFAGRIASR